MKPMEVRQVKGSNKSNQGLLRRFKRGQGEHQDGQLQAQWRSMQKELQGKDEERTTSAKECFISQECSLQETRAFLEDDQMMEEILKMEDIPWERFFGLVGIPVSHTVLNYTDPMNIGINEHLKEVVSSSECSLNQKSLWTMSGKRGTLVNCGNIARTWGFKSEVTGIVPIKSWNHPAVWKAYHKGPLIKILMSAQLRGAAPPCHRTR